MSPSSATLRFSPLSIQASEKHLPFVRFQCSCPLTSSPSKTRVPPPVNRAAPYKRVSFQAFSIVSYTSPGPLLTRLFRKQSKFSAAV